MMKKWICMSDECHLKCEKCTDTVLVKKDYLSIRTQSNDREYITAIAQHLLGEPYNFNITQNAQDIVHVKRGVE